MRARVAGGGAGAAALLALALAGGTHARTLEAGEGAPYPTLAAAARAAGDGDTIRLRPGEYFECASLAQAGLVLEGIVQDGRAPVLTDRTCEDKALLVLRGPGITVRDLVLTRARVPDGNGAGIRLEAPGLVLERVRFENNQVGLLGGAGTIRVLECAFVGGGVGGDRPLAAVLVGGAALLRIERSAFEGGKGGHVASAATRTELEGNRFALDAEVADGPVVNSTAGLLLMEGNVVALGPVPPPRDAAIVATGEAAVLRNNRMENRTGRPMTLLLDWTPGSPVLEGNVVAPGDAASSTRGAWRHRAGGMARATAGGMREAAGAVKRGLLGMVGR